MTLSISSQYTHETELGARKCGSDMMWGWEVNRGLAQQGVKGSMTSKFWRGPSWTSHSIDLSRYHRMQSPSSHSWHAVAT